MERFEKSPWITGDDKMLNALISHIRNNGGSVKSEGFYVPFSNGCELGIHGEKAMTSELLYVTTERQFVNNFV
jgi:hypothetical protein